MYSSSDEKGRRKINEDIRSAERAGFFLMPRTARRSKTPHWYTSDEDAAQEGLALMRELGMVTT